MRFSSSQPKCLLILLNLKYNLFSDVTIILQWRLGPSWFVQPTEVSISTEMSSTNKSPHTSSSKLPLDKEEASESVVFQLPTICMVRIRENHTLLKGFKQRELLILLLNSKSFLSKRSHKIQILDFIYISHECICSAFKVLVFIYNCIIS